MARVQPGTHRNEKRRQTQDAEPSQPIVFSSLRQVEIMNEVLQGPEES